MIGTEFKRAEEWQNQDMEKFRGALERAIELIDLTLKDDKWRGNSKPLLVLRNEVAKFYIGERKDSVSILYSAL